MYDQDWITATFTGRNFSQLRLIPALDLRLFWRVLSIRAQHAKYPDSRPMGFPFDRRPAPTFEGRSVQSAADYAQADNMFLHDITIKFLGDQLENWNELDFECPGWIFFIFH